MKQLLCTFSDKDAYAELIERLKRVYTIHANKIFVFESDDTESFLISYNIMMTPNMYFPENTISVHRKFETNTMYTINAMNQIIRDENNGTLNIKYRVNWNDYKNSILLIREQKFTKINTKLHTIVTI